MLFTPLLCTCAASQKTRLPAELKEASGLATIGDRWYWHNDSGDGPYVYVTDKHARLLAIDTLAADAVDYEDITRDPAGNLYVADVGNNRGRRKELQVYRYAPGSAATDTIAFHYPIEFWRGRRMQGENNCEALVYHGAYLHLFTKGAIGRASPYYTYHFRVPARPGNYVAELVDSLYLPGRVVTAAALDSTGRELALTAYTFNRALGFLPNGAATLYVIKDYPGDHFLRGALYGKPLSWGIPTQFEAIDMDEKYFYVASEATAARRHGIVRKIPRGQVTKAVKPTAPK